MKKQTKIIVLLVILLVVFLSTALAATRTFRIQETEFIKILPEVFDPDYDQIVYNFSSPLDEKGEWQTDYGDAGEYLIKITADDGFSKTKENILLIVEDRNEPPKIIKNKFSLKEGQKLDLTKAVEDPEDDVLVFSLDEPFNEKGIWQTGYEDEGTYIFDFKVNDGEFDVQVRVDVIIIPANQPPEIIKVFSTKKELIFPEGGIIKFYTEVSGHNGERLTYSWEFDGKIIGDSPSGEWQFNFESDGEYTLKLKVSDGASTVEKEWKIIVENTNRKPVLELSSVTVKEGETAFLDLPDVDEDGDFLTFSFSEFFNQEGEWQTTYEDEGEYEIEVTVSDGELEETTRFLVIVLNVDRSPLLDLPLKVNAKEGETLYWDVPVDDPDGEELNITFVNLPKEALFDKENKTIIWTPGYETIKRKEGFLSNVLGAMQLEHYFLQKKSFPVKVNVCGRELCRSGTTYFSVQNTNRAPILNKSKINLNETEILSLKPEAYDLDGDLIKYTYTSPIGRRTGNWQTNFGDQGNYTAYVTATDGELSITVPVEITVIKNNREPTLRIKDDDLTVNEGEEFIIHVKASDLDEDSLDLSLSNLPTGASFAEEKFVWSPSYDIVEGNGSKRLDNLVSNFPYLNKKLSGEKEVIWLDFTVSDGEAEVIHPVKITVKNMNQVPRFISTSPQQMVEVKINEPVLFKVNAFDNDGDHLDYTWNFGLLDGEVHGTNIIQRRFVTSGEKEVKIVVSDGRDEIEYVWKIKVTNKRAEFIEEALDQQNYKVVVVRY